MLEIFALWAFPGVKKPRDTHSFMKTNEQLFLRAKKLAKLERRITTAVLDVLHEIERRKAYCELKYDGLYSYCVRELRYTESEAHYRVQSMRAVKEHPEIKPMLESGVLSATAVVKVRAHLKSDLTKRSTEEKLSLYQAMENCTIKEVVKKLSVIKGEEIKRKLTLELSEETSSKWDKVKGLE